MAPTTHRPAGDESGRKRETRPAPNLPRLCGLAAAAARPCWRSSAACSGRRRVFPRLPLRRAGVPEPGGGLPAADLHPPDGGRRVGPHARARAGGRPAHGAVVAAVLPAAVLRAAAPVPLDRAGRARRTRARAAGEASVVLQPRGVLPAALCYVGLFFALLWMARPRRAAWTGPVGMMVYVVTLYLLGVDWVMSLEPGWYSTGFPVIFMAGQALSALAFCIVAVTIIHGTSPPAGRGQAGTTAVVEGPRQPVAGRAHVLGLRGLQPVPRRVVRQPARAGRVVPAPQRGRLARSPHRAWRCCNCSSP